MDSLLEEVLLWGQAGDTGDETEKVLDATRSLATDLCQDMPISKRGNLELVSAFADKVQKTQRESVATTWLLSEHNIEVDEPELKAHLLIDASVGVSYLKKQLATQHPRIAVLEESSKIVNKSLVSITGTRDVLRKQLDWTRALIDRKDRIICDFTDRFCGTSSSLVCKRFTSCHDRLNSRLVDAPIRGENLGGFFVRISENEQSLHMDDPDGEKE